MQLGKIQLIIVLLLVLCGLVSAVTEYTYGCNSPMYFTIEGKGVTISSINIQTYTTTPDLPCTVSASSYVGVYYPDAGGDIDYSKMKKDDKVSFWVTEQSTNLQVDIELKMGIILTVFDKSCDGNTCTCSPRSDYDEACFSVLVYPTTFCTDPDGEDTSTVGTATRVEITPEHIGDSDNINMYPKNKEAYTDRCEGDKVFETFCEGSYPKFKEISCGTGKICGNGICVAACVDNDGSDKNTFGYVTLGSIQTWDSCLDENTVTEQTCSNNAKVEVSLSCDNGYECDEGKCVEIPEIVPVAFCTDSDGGEILSIKGTTRAGTKDSSTQVEISASEEKDSCTDADTVREYICQNNAIVPLDRNCPVGTTCTNGKCLTSTDDYIAFCTDTDNGKTYTSKGTIEVGTKNATGFILSSQQFIDNCIDDQTVMEYYCSGEEEASVEKICSTDEECIDGACTTIDLECTDSDTGQDSSEKGTVISTQDPTPFTDYCINETLLIEYFCSFYSEITNTAVSCGTGQVCSSGECVSEIPKPEIEEIIIQFKKGWNLFSLPYENAELTSDCEGFDLVKKRWHYDTETMQWTHPVNLVKGKGYWFKAKEECTLTIEGSIFSLEGTELKKGWNQIGSSTENKDFNLLLSSCDVIDGPWEYNAAQKKYEEATTNMAGKGYFVKVSNNCSLE